MGFFDRFRRKQVEDKKEEQVEVRNNKDSQEETYRSIYNGYIEEIENLRKQCEQNQIDFKMMLDNHSVDLPKSFEEFYADFSYFSDIYLQKVPELTETVKREVANKNRKMETNSNKSYHPSSQTNLSQSQNMDSEWLEVAKTIPNSELGNVVDDIYDGMNQMFNSDRVTNWVADISDKYEAMEQQQRQVEKEQLIQQIFNELENNNKFKENCKVYNSPNAFINAVMNEMERAYNHSQKEVYNLAGAGAINLKIFCTKSEKERNQIFFKDIVNIPVHKKGLNGKPNQAQQKSNAYRNFLIKHMDFIARDYQLGMDANALAKEYYQKFSEYQKYFQKTNQIIKLCEDNNINYNNIFQQNNVPIIDSFEAYYDYPNKDNLESILDNQIAPMISTEFRKNQIEIILKDLANNDKFKENMQNYESGPAFVNHIIEQLSIIYSQTKDEAYNPNDITFIKMYCLMSEEERNTNFNNSLASATESKGFK